MAIVPFQSFVDSSDGALVVVNVSRKLDTVTRLLIGPGQPT